MLGQTCQLVAVRFKEALCPSFKPVKFDPEAITLIRGEMLHDCRADPAVAMNAKPDFAIAGQLQLRGLLKIAAIPATGASADVSKEDPFGGTPTKQDCHLVLEFAEGSLIHGRWSNGLASPTSTAKRVSD